MAGKLVPTDFYSREDVKNLHLVHGKGKSVKERESNIPNPNVLMTAPLITTQYPDLVSLHIEGWDVDDWSFIHLWNGLPHLETLSIEDCTILTDFGFIGEIPSSPVFLNLKELKKFSINLEYMPSITDALFKEVLCHVQLTEFNLKSDSSLTKVTKDGILSLLNGEFARSIKKFPFHNFRMSGVDEEELELIKNRFGLIE